MLQVIISPAKQMSCSQDAFSPRGIPPFPETTERIRRALLHIERAGGAAALKELWHVSDKLLEENIKRLHGISPVSSKMDLQDTHVARAVGSALFSYIGIQYQSLAPQVLDLDALTWLEEHLWILSAFYGCVRPFDAVQPYRLEMSTKLALGDARNLYGLWGDSITHVIEDAARRDGSAPAVVNLASAEYAKAVLPHLQPETTIVTCVFGEELRSGKPVQRATASKIARGSMVRWMAEHRLEDVRELARFDVGYRVVGELSSADKLVFLRAPSAQQTKGRATAG